MNAEQIREIVQQTIRQELAAFFSANAVVPSRPGEDLLAVIAAQGPAAGVKFAQGKLSRRKAA